MSYPRQVSVADRLQSESMDALERMRDQSWMQILRAWSACRVDLRGFILHTYHSHFQGENWTLASLKTSGAASMLSHGLHERINAFKNHSWQLAKGAINGLYAESVLRHSWVIDQTTPPNIVVKIPNDHQLKLIESSQIAYYTGAKATQKFEQTWGAWSDGYYVALMNNVQLGALNESSASDAADEVDATRVNTPAYGLMDALQRVFAFESVAAMNEGINTVAEINDEADVVQIWETRRNTRVCEDCEANEGLTEEEVDGEIPAHPNCNCYWRIVPKSWAGLLRDGDDLAYDTAVRMDAQGLVPNAMVLRDPAGDLAGYTTVKFSAWKKQNYHTVGAR